MEAGGTFLVGLARSQARPKMVARCCGFITARAMDRFLVLQIGPLDRAVGAMYLMRMTVRSRKKFLAETSA